jgi:hypothetical protein
LTDIWATALVVLGRRPAAMPAGLATLIDRASSLDVHDVEDAVFAIRRRDAAPLGKTA